MRIPKDYKCAERGASGCKLWRKFDSYGLRFLCAKCAMTEEGVNFYIDANGEHALADGDKIDNIGRYVRAVLDNSDANGSFWGYTEEPKEDLDWWRSLPTYPE